MRTFAHIVMQLPCRLGLAVLLAGSACGGGQTRGTPFDPRWVDDHGAAMTWFQASFRAVRVPLGVDVAVGVIGKNALVGVPLDGGAPWTFEHVLHGRPAVAGSVVVSAGGGEVFALEARTGRLLWSRPSGGRVRGAGDDGVTTVVSLLPTTGYGSLVLAIKHDGSVARQLEDIEAIGTPAVVGNIVFFPWKGRFLSVYDMLSGDEKARVVFPNGVNRAFALGGAIFAGAVALTRVDDLADNTVALPLPLGGLPGNPAWMRPGTDWVIREAETIDKVRLYARPIAAGPAGIEGDRFAATDFRIALGLDAVTGALAWVHAHDADFLGGAAYHGGFALCDASGAVTFLDGRSGGVAGRVSLGKAIDACVVQTDALMRPAVPGAGSLVEQIERALQLRQVEVVAVQKLLRRELSRIDSAGVGR
jgi:outer membrane protein assembly factor BamB